jgi:2'-5' RNA ligase
MAEALVMFLDAAASAAINELRDRLARHGLIGPDADAARRHRPHISLAVAPTLTLKDSSLLSRIADQRLDIRMESLGTFAGPQGILFLGVTVTHPLLAAHTAVHASLDGDGGGPWGHFRPGIWSPHCTLATGLDAPALGAAVSLLHPLQELTARVIAVGTLETGGAPPNAAGS